MFQTMYIKLEQKIQVTKPEVTVADLGTIFCTDKDAQNCIRVLQVHKFPQSAMNGRENPKCPNRVVISILQIVKLIKEKYPEISVVNLGEVDTVVELVKVNKHKVALFWLKVALVCFICFFGTAFTIMAFHNDIGITDVFAKYYENITGKQTNGVTILEVSYTVGLVAGMCIFFNHIGGRRLTKDPTPIEVENKIYEDEVNRTLIAIADREGREIDVD